MTWPPFHHENTTYDLTHLHPKCLTYTQPAKGSNPARAYNVDVIFSMHCFTRGVDHADPDPALLYSDNKETRIFDFRRYELSRQLPCIVEQLMNCKCFHTGRDNFLTIPLIDEQGNNVDYEIYFTASKATRPSMVNLYIQSAYVRDAAHHGNRPHRKPIGFPIILYNTLNKKPIHAPK